MSGKRLITDRDVLTGAVRSPLVLDGDTLLTPSARDRAVRLGWTIVDDGATRPATSLPSIAGSSSCARCGKSGCAGDCAGCGAGGARGAGSAGSARLDALADGLYLVRIEGGQMVSALPASGPGLMQRSPAARGLAIEQAAARDASAARGATTGSRA